MVVLVPMAEDEFSVFFNAVAESHARDNVVAGRWSASEASALARDETRRLLPGNEKTPEHYLFVLRDTDLESEIGYLWFGSTTRANKRVTTNTDCSSRVLGCVLTETVGIDVDRAFLDAKRSGFELKAFGTKETILKVPGQLVEAFLQGVDAARARGPGGG